jgi:hypothetical protein
VVEVGLGGVDRDDGAVALAEHGAPRAVEILEMQVPDVARVVVARHHHEGVALDPVEVALGLRVLLLEPERGQVAGADDDVRFDPVDLRDRALHQVRDEVRVAAMDVRQMSDREGRAHEKESKAGRARPIPLLPWWE